MVSLNFAAMRENMIQGQLLPVQALTKPLHQAAETLPREFNLPEELKPLAYSDQELFLSEDRFMLSPPAFFKLVSAASISPRDRVLDVGCTTGYTSATLSYLSKHVVGIESSEVFANQARLFMEKRNMTNVEIVQAPLWEGCADLGPYDVIVVEGVLNEIPPSFFDQLKENGRIAFFRRKNPGELSTGICAHKKNGSLFEVEQFHWQASELVCEA